MDGMSEVSFAGMRGDVDGTEGDFEASERYRSERPKGVGIYLIVNSKTEVGVCGDVGHGFRSRASVRSLWCCVACRYLRLMWTAHFLGWLAPIRKRMKPLNVLGRNSRCQLFCPGNIWMVLSYFM